MRYAAAKIIGATLCGTLLATLEPAMEHRVARAQIVSSFDDTFGIQAGEALTPNRSCVCARGAFTATSAASALSRSALFKQMAVPVVARFSNAGGSPHSRSARALELEFRLPGGSVQNMSMLNTPSFSTADSAAFGEMIVAVKPDPATAKPDLQRLQQFLSAHPQAFRHANFVTATEPPRSYASATYFSIHTFRFIDAHGRTHLVRWRFVPPAGEASAPPDETVAPGEDAVGKNFIERLASGKPARWDMIVYEGETADTADNASIAWPEERRHFKAGTLTITQALWADAAECKGNGFDPLIVADGIAPTDDPVLLFRSPTYGPAFSRTLARALASSHRAPAGEQ